MRRGASSLAALAALMGAAATALAAYAAHGSGSELGRTAALHLALTAAALLGVAAYVQDAGPRVALVAGYALAAGACIFSGDLAMRALYEVKLFPFAAPIGGSTMILAWAALAAAFVFGRPRV